MSLGAPTVEDRALRSALNGISGVHVTPFTRGKCDAVDFGVLEELLESLVTAGIGIVVTGGNTGEFSCLAASEIADIYRIAARSVVSRSLLLAGVGGGLTDALATARLASKIGADGLLAHEPATPFMAPAGYVEYVRRLAAGANLPIVLYVRNDFLSAEDYLHLAEIEGVVGVKYASKNLLALSAHIRATRDTDLQWICGSAEIWAPPMYALGVRGFTSGLVNVFPRRSIEILNSLERGDYDGANVLIAEIAPFEEMRTKFGNGANVTVVKEAMALLGWRVGLPRPPGLPALDDDDRETLARLLRSWGLPCRNT